MVRKIAYMGILTGLAISLGWLERLIPLQTAVPGVKLGISNIVTLITLYLFGGGYAFAITGIRVLLTGVLYGGVSGMIYGLSGGFLSCAVMIALFKTKKPTVIGISTAGGVFHNLGQLVIAAVVVNNAGMFYYLPVLIVSGAVAGLVTGVCAYFVILSLKKLSTVKS